MGVVEHMRVAGAVVVDRQSLISEEIYASLLLAPMPRGMTNIPPGGVSHQEYWSLPPSEREARQRRLHKLPPDLARVASTAGMPAYEASQPPLFYAIVAGLLTPLGGASLLTRVWAARCITVLIASVTIPIAYRVFINVWNDDRLALSGISLIAAAPGFVLKSGEGIKRKTGCPRLHFSAVGATAGVEKFIHKFRYHARHRLRHWIADESILSHHVASDTCDLRFSSLQDAA
jgi:hypothetical protein